MKILVFVKQVPEVSSLSLDPETRTLRREGVRLEVSGFDIRAAVRAIELRDAAGSGEVVCVTMGPPQAREALEFCLALGADRGIHLEDAAFAGADTLATANALAAFARAETFDLALFGRASTDSETGHVGPQVAALLDLPQVTGAAAVDWIDAPRSLRVRQELDDGFANVELEAPAVLTVTEDAAEERFPRRKDREAAKDKPIDVVRAADLGDPAAFGAAGSPTSVGPIRVEAPAREARVLDGEPGAIVDELIEHLRARRAASPDAASPPSPEPRDETWMVWIEVRGGKPRRASLELLAKARTLAADVVATVIGAGPAADPATLALHGATKVLRVEGENLGEYRTEGMTTALLAAIDEIAPDCVLLPSTAMGRDLAPRVAALRGLGLTGDGIDLDFDDDGRLRQWKPAFGGSIVAPIFSTTIPAMATIRPGMFALRTFEGTAEVRTLTLESVPEERVRRIGFEPLAEADEAEALERAGIVVGVGMGMASGDGLAAAKALASSLGASLAATRDVVEEGRAPRQIQVGLTGRAIGPLLYLGLGIRGAPEHMVGLRNAETLVAVNDNPKAPVFGEVDFGLVGDANEIAPLLAEKLRGLFASRD